MKRTIKLAILLFFSLSIAANALDPNSVILPKEYKLYRFGSIGGEVYNWQAPNTFEVTLPTINHYMGDRGCYLNCYSHDEKNSVYPINTKIFVMGQIRVEGRYNKRFCVPKHYENKVIGKEEYFKELCGQLLPNACKDKSCWVGGDTGKWLGLQ